MGPDHWSVARKDENQEALEYYRQRSHAPGVEEGGGPRNFYCMRCDGVIPVEPFEVGALAATGSDDPRCHRDEFVDPLALFGLAGGFRGGKLLVHAGSFGGTRPFLARARVSSARRRGLGWVREPT